MTGNNPEMFDVDVAKLLDLNCGAVYYKIHSFELEKRDGRRWVSATIKQWCKLIPFLTENQIRHALERLEEAGLIVTGDYNENPFDRTKWYSTNPIPKSMRL